MQCPDPTFMFDHMVGCRDICDTFAVVDALRRAFDYMIDFLMCVKLVGVGITDIVMLLHLLYDVVNNNVNYTVFC